MKIYPGRSNQGGAIFTFLLSLIILFCYYHRILLNPDTWLLYAEGDAIKNYYSFMYHARYDTEYFRFDGMNYPYNTYIINADAQPVLSWLTGKLGLAHHGVAVINLLMLLSYPLCAVCIYYLFRFYGVSPLWGSVAAVAITFMNPQVFRMLVHHSLSYPWVIPLAWLLIAQSLRSKGYLPSVFMGLLILFMSQVHIYLMIMLAMMSACILVFSYLLGEEQKKRGWLLSRMLIQVVIPLVIFKLIVAYTDPHMDRTSTPSGFFEYYANLSSILLPYNSSLGEWINQHLFKLPPVNWEGENYVGLTTIVFVLILSVMAVVATFPIQQAILRKELFPLWITAFIFLLCACCIPFRFDAFRWMADYLGPFRQLRSLGRFSWIFYNIITISAVICLYHVYLRSYRKKLVGALFMAGMIGYMVESHAHHSHVTGRGIESVNVFRDSYMKEEFTVTTVAIRDLNPDALMVLPFNHYSSDKYDIIASDASMKDALLLGYYTGMPLLNASIPRASISESANFTSLFAPVFIEKPLTDDIGKDKRILIVHNGEQLSYVETGLIEHSVPAGSNGRFQYYWLAPEALYSEDSVEKLVTRFADLEIEEEAIENSGAGVPYWHYFNGFNQETCIRPFSGSGQFHSLLDGYLRVMEFKVSGLPDAEITVSFWLRAEGEINDNVVGIIEHIRENGDVNWLTTTQSIFPRQHYGDWKLMECRFRVPEREGKIRVVLGNVEHTLSEIWLDDLLMRPSGQDHYRKAKLTDGEYAVFNNYLLRRLN